MAGVLVGGAAAELGGEVVGHGGDDAANVIVAILLEVVGSSVVRRGLWIGIGRAVAEPEFIREDPPEVAGPVQDAEDLDAALDRPVEDQLLAEARDRGVLSCPLVGTDSLELSGTPVDPGDAPRLLPRRSGRGEDRQIEIRSTMFRVTFFRRRS